MAEEEVFLRSQALDWYWTVVIQDSIALSQYDFEAQSFFKEWASSIKGELGL